MSNVWVGIAGISAAVSAAILLVAAIVAIKQVGEARKLRGAQIRPFVTIDFEVQRRAPFVYLDISNLGSTLARNVRF